MYSSVIGDLTNAIFILSHGDIYITDEIMGIYRTDRVRSASSYNSTRTRKKIYEEHIDLIKKLEQKLPEKVDFTYRKIRYTNEYLNSISDNFLKKIIAIMQIINTLGLKFFILNMQKFIW